tara:strand:- start:198 stop:629 length:432 start_codon:yes stop_codon:yes gene_type:complete
MKKLLFILLLMPLTVFSQNTEVLENDSKENRFNVGWAYYGRGSGVSLTYDREFSNFFSAGIGFEEYFSEEETEMSYFLITDFHLSKLLKTPNSVDIYPGAEFGSFGESFEAHYYLGVSILIKKNMGIFTELGSRGILGLYYQF